MNKDSTRKARQRRALVLMLVASAVLGTSVVGLAAQQMVGRGLTAFVDRQPGVGATSEPEAPGRSQSPSVSVIAGSAATDAPVQQPAGTRVQERPNAAVQEPANAAVQAPANAAAQEPTRTQVEEPANAAVQEPASTPLPVATALGPPPPVVPPPVVPPVPVAPPAPAVSRVVMTNRVLPRAVIRPLKPQA